MGAAQTKRLTASFMIALMLLLPFYVAGVFAEYNGYDDAVVSYKTDVNAKTGSWARITPLDNKEIVTEEKVAVFNNKNNDEDSAKDNDYNKLIKYAAVAVISLSLGIMLSILGTQVLAASILAVPFFIFLALAEKAEAAPNIQGVTATVLTDTSAEINWTTDEESTTKVMYGLDRPPQTPAEIYNPRYSFNHSISLPGLTPNRTYYFSVESANRTGSLEVDNNSGEFYNFITFETIEISDIEVYDIGLDNATINWTTNIQSSSIVYYSNDSTNLSNIAAGTDNVVNHSVTLSSLEPGVIYYYKVKSGYLESRMDYFETRTDATIPYITNVTLPANYLDGTYYYNDTSIDIAIETEANAAVTVNVIHNDRTGQSERQAADENGTAVFYGIRVYEGDNIVNISAEDAGGNLNWTSLNLTIDLETPHAEITTSFPSVTSNSSLNITGTVSDALPVGIIVMVISGETSEDSTHAELENVSGEFSAEISLNDGLNIIQITFTDWAGNSFVYENTTTYDASPPTIENVTPISGSFFYEDFGKIRIEGDTKPFAKVKLFLHELDDDPDMETTADENGHFVFEDVDIEKDISIGECRDRCNRECEDREDPRDRLDCISRCIDRCQDREISDEARETKVYLIAEDTLGRESIEKLVTYYIGTCSSGGMNYNIINLVEYQSPTRLSVERLADGTEIISFILNLSYFGTGSEADVVSLSIGKACADRETRNDSRYELGCDLLPGSTSIKKMNQGDGQGGHLVYVRYRLRRDDSLLNFSQDLWRDLYNNEVVFPLKIRLRYSHKEFSYSTNHTTVTQTKCMPVTYFVDTSRLDPRKVMSSVIEEGIKIANKTIENIDEVLPHVETAVRYAAVGCIASFLARLIVKIYRKITCKIEQLAPSTGEENRCTEDIETKGSDDELGDYCPSCASAWKLEKQLYSAYRWTCDRLLCHKSPAAWTADEDPVEIERRIKDMEKCADTGGDNLRGYSMIERTCIIYEAGTTSTQPCYKYVHNNEVAGYQVLGSRGNDVYELERVDIGGEVARGDFPQTILAIKEGNSMLTHRMETCKQACSRVYGSLDSGCITQAEAETKQAKKSLGFTEGCEVWDRPIDEQQQCYCYDDDLAEILLTDWQPDPWNYRFWQSNRTEYDKKYSKYIYYPERDRPACFGQNSWIKPSTPVLQPKQHVSAAQCLCLSGIRNRLKLLREISLGLRNCFVQIQETGEADTGICKELFTQFLCGLTYEVVNAIGKGCVPWEVDFKEKDLANFASIASSSILESIDESANELRDEYGNAVLDNYLQGGEGAIARKICLGALTGDWGLDLEDIVDAAYADSLFNTEVSSWPAEREYMTWDPSTRRAMYEYSVAWDIFPGCQIENYRVELSCINDAIAYRYDLNCDKAQTQDDHPHRGCDCWERGNEVVHPFASGRRIDSGTYVDESEHEVIESNVRYDHVKISLGVDSRSREDCLPEGHEDGVFYFPIYDRTGQDILACHFDQSTGEFICDRGGLVWEEGGRAYVDDVACVGGSIQSGRDCTQRGAGGETLPFTFFTGEDIEIQPRIYNIGNPKCFYAKVMKGSNIKKGDAFMDVYVNTTHTYPLMTLFRDITLGGGTGGNVEGRIFGTVDKPVGSSLLQDYDIENYPLIITSPSVENTNDPFTIIFYNDEGNTGELDITPGSDNKIKLPGWYEPKNISELHTEEFCEGEGSRSCAKCSSGGCHILREEGSKKVSFTITDIPLPALTPDEARINSITFQIIPTAPLEEGSSETWYIHYKLTQMPEDATECDRRVVNYNALTYNDVPQQKTLPIIIEKGEPRRGTPPGLAPGLTLDMPDSLEDFLGDASYTEGIKIDQISWGFIRDLPDDVPIITCINSSNLQGAVLNNRIDFMLSDVSRTPPFDLTCLKIGIGSTTLDLLDLSCDIKVYEYWEPNKYDSRAFGDDSNDYPVRVHHFWSTPVLTTHWYVLLGTDASGNNVRSEPFHITYNITGEVTPLAPADEEAEDHTHLIFVTDDTFDGNLGGLEGANEKCQSAADATGNRELSGTWMAMLSDDSFNLVYLMLHVSDPYGTNYISNDAPFYRMDGQMIANNISDLFDGSIEVPININEYNDTITTAPSSVWTGSNETGGSVENTCDYWASDIARNLGAAGRIDRTDTNWLGNSDFGCNMENRLYCLRMSND